MKVLIHKKEDGKVMTKWYAYTPKGQKKPIAKPVSIQLDANGVATSLSGTILFDTREQAMAYAETGDTKGMCEYLAEFIQDTPTQKTA